MVDLGIRKECLERMPRHETVTYIFDAGVESLIPGQPLVEARY